MPALSKIRHQAAQSQPEMTSVSTQTDECCLPYYVHNSATHTPSVETRDVLCQVRKPTLTFVVLM